MYLFYEVIKFYINFCNIFSEFSLINLGHHSLIIVLISFIIQFFLYVMTIYFVTM